MSAKFHKCAAMVHPLQSAPARRESSAHDAEVMLSARRLHVEERGRKILEIAELSVGRGETLSIVGPNGAGKSTLLRVLGLLEAPTRGDLWFHGEAVSWDPPRLLALRRRTAIVFQAPLLCRTSVFRNVALGLRLRGVPRAERARRAGEWLERFGIAHLAERPAHRISGGEAQRTSLARAFVLEPEVLLLDEPFAALDPPSRQALAAELQQLLAETLTTTVFVTHDRDEAFALGDRVVVLLGGEVAQIGSPDEVARRPANEAVARFVGIETIVPGRVVATSADSTTIEIGSIRLIAGPSWRTADRAVVCLRAEDVSLIVDATVQPPPGWNVLRGTVVSLVSWGTQVRVMVDCRVTVTALTTRLLAGSLGLRPGQKVRLAFSPLSVHLIPQ